MNRACAHCGNDLQTLKILNCPLERCSSCGTIVINEDAFVQFIVSSLDSADGPRIPWETVDTEVHHEEMCCPGCGEVTRSQPYMAVGIAVQSRRCSHCRLIMFSAREFSTLNQALRDEKRRRFQSALVGNQF